MTLLRWCSDNGMHINTKKTKEMTFTFSKRVRVDQCAPLRAGSEVIERVQEFKILGLILSSDLKWTTMYFNTLWPRPISVCMLFVN